MLKLINWIKFQVSMAFIYLPLESITVIQYSRNLAASYLHLFLSKRCKILKVAAVGVDVYKLL